MKSFTVIRSACPTLDSSSGTPTSPATTTPPRLHRTHRPSELGLSSGATTTTACHRIRLSNLLRAITLTTTPRTTRPPRLATTQPTEPTGTPGIQTLRTSRRMLAQPPVPLPKCILIVHSPVTTCTQLHRRLETSQSPAPTTTGELPMATEQLLMVTIMRASNRPRQHLSVIKIDHALMAQTTSNTQHSKIRSTVLFTEAVEVFLFLSSNG